MKRGAARALPEVGLGLRYQRSGILAIQPQAFFELYFRPPDPPVNRSVGDVEIIDIRGPLDQHDEGWCDSYESILSRMDTACEGPATTVLLYIDSPGGEAAGCFDTARALRLKAAVAGKRLVAYVSGSGCSGAYALACAAESITISDTSVVGSIGVISTRFDYSGNDASHGLRVAFITSGARKADGHPDNPITDAELEASQQIIDSMAQVFFGLVSELRGIDTAALKALQAGVFHGPAALAARLADQVNSFEQLLAGLASDEETMKPSVTKYEDTRAALEELANGDGDEAAAAKRALAAMDDKPKDDDGDGDGDKPKEDDKPKDDKDAAAAAAGGLGAQILREVRSLGARLHRVETKGDDAERDALLAARPDLAEELVRELKTTALADVKRILAAMPKQPKPRPVVTTTVVGTRGAGQGDARAARQEPSAKQQLDQRMGLVKTRSIGVIAEPHRLTLGAPVAVPAQPVTPPAGE
jgi:ClpP class serine protease